MKCILYDEEKEAWIQVDLHTLISMPFLIKFTLNEINLYKLKCEYASDEQIDWMSPLWIDIQASGITDVNFDLDNSLQRLEFETICGFIYNCLWESV